MSDALMDAIKARDAARVEQLLADDPAAASARGPGGESPLLLAAYFGAADIVALLAARVRLDVHEATAVDNGGALRALIAADPAAVRRYSHDGWSPLHLAGFFGHLGAARILLDGGAPLDLRSTNHQGNEPLHAAVAGRCSPDVIALLLERGASPNAKATGGHTAVHLAAARGSPPVLDLLIAHGGDIHARTDDGKSPADFANERGHAEVARWLETRAEG